VGSRFELRETHWCDPGSARAPEVLEWVQPHQEHKLKEWDDFLLDSTRGHYSQLSTWLASFRAYGFRYQILIAREGPDSPVGGGIAILTFEWPAIRIAVAPMGPILEHSHEQWLGPIMTAALREASHKGDAVLQVRFPCEEGPCTVPEMLLPSVELPEGLQPRTGAAIRSANVPDDMLWVKLPKDMEGDAFREHKLGGFRQQTRRHIRHAERAGLEVFDVDSEAGLKAAFEIFEENGEQHGYATRRWEEFGPALLAQVRQGHAVVLGCRRNGRFIGALYTLVAGRRLSAIMAGTRRVDGEQDTGHFLHWMGILKAKALGLDGYDLTSRSVDSVFKFKMGFRPHLVRLGRPRYFVLSPWRYRFYSLIYPHLLEHKAGVARALSAVARAFEGQG
jgi:hypothetical protein